MNQVALPPEKFDIATAYIENRSNAEATAKALGIPISSVIDVIEDPQVSKYLNHIYLDRGYRNKEKLGQIIDDVIESKLSEALESGVYSQKDLLEWVKIAIDLRDKESKTSGITSATQVNVNDFGGGNYGELISKLIKNPGK